MESQRLFGGERSEEPFSSLSGRAASPIPKRQVALALGLLAGGLVLLVIGLSLFYTEADRSPGIVLLCAPTAASTVLDRAGAEASGAHGRCLGCLCFIPGAYYTWIAFAAYTGRRGYRWDDMLVS